MFFGWGTVRCPVFDRGLDGLLTEERGEPDEGGGGCT